MMRPPLTLLCAATFVAFLAACGGGGSASGGASGTPPTQPSSNSSSFTLQSQSTSVTLPPVQGYSGTISMPAGMGTVVITSGMQPPSGIPAPSGITPMMYISFTASGGAVSMTQTPGFDMDMSSGMMGSQSYYMAQYQNGTWSTVEGPAMMSGTSMMMNSPAAPISLSDGQQTCFAYYMGNPIGSWSPAPSATPSMMP